MLIRKEKGFTLIELLVVVAIVGVLATVVLASLNSARLKAQNVAARAEMKQIEKLVISAQVSANKTMFELTGSGCSDCVCRTEPDLAALPDTHNCVGQWGNAIRLIINASETNTPPEGFYKDPWGSPYLLDENESLNNCVKDELRSVGPNRLFENGTGDDIAMRLPFAKCS